MNFGDTVFLYISSGLFSFLVVWISNVLMTKRLSMFKIIIFLSLFAGLLTTVRFEWISTMSFLKIASYLVVFLYFFGAKRILREGQHSTV